MQSNLSSSTSLMRLHSIYSDLHQHRDTPFYLRKKNEELEMASLLYYI